MTTIDIGQDPSQLSTEELTELAKQLSPEELRELDRALLGQSRVDDTPADNFPDEIKTAAYTKGQYDALADLGLL